ncbi:MAG: protein translocase subunit SecD [bacterium]|nr:protein translocase subunit SecD [bacterium]
MGRIAKWKVILIIVVIAASLWFIYPTIRWYSLSKTAQAKLSKSEYEFLNKRKLKLGLDLQGGVHMLLKVDMDKVQQLEVAKEIDRVNADFANARLDAKAVYGGATVINRIQYANKAIEPAVKNILDKSLLLKEDRAVPRQEHQIALSVAEKFIQDKHGDIMDRARKVIETRVNQLGLSETNVAYQGTDRIVVQLPGEEDPERASQLIQKQAFLEFKIVADPELVDKIIEVQTLTLKPGAVVPEGYELKYLRETKDGQPTTEPVLLRSKAELTGEHIAQASVKFDPMKFGAPYVELKLDRKGALIFERVTAANVKKRLAIVLDGDVKSAPVIRERIGGGNAMIEGRFSMEEAKDLAIALKAGALPAPLVIEESRAIGPSLGLDSIQKGVFSAILGGLLVAGFMVFYYRGSGLIATMALVLNLIILIATLGALDAVLTVPGIAGIILTIGMAVDANVLIFERIREELRAGKTVRSAIAAGYTRAFRAILDSNVTTIIAAIMLFQFGTGPVRGFAITLSLGLLASMFTAILVTRVVFDRLTLQRSFTKLSI